MTKQTLYLIDGHAIAYRAYFALSAGGAAARWTTSQGEPTAGIYGFASILLRILEKEHPEFLAVAFDTGKTFRNEMFSGYKATRAKMPEDLRPQIERMRELIDSFGIPRLEKEGFEADDVLGSTAKTAELEGLNVKIITGDKDLLQLVDDRISVSLSGSSISDAKDFNSEAVTAYLGIPPSLVVDYKALIGDPSDNYPGVAGIGPKTAIPLLQTYQSLDGIYERLSDLKGAVKTKLEKGKEDAYLSQRLAQIRTDLVGMTNFSEAATDKLNFPAAEKLFKTLEFKTLIPKLRKIAPLFYHAEQPGLFDIPANDPNAEKESFDGTFQVVDTEEKLALLKAKITDVPLIAVDTETTGTNSFSCRLVGISLAVEKGEGFYIPVGHMTGEPQLPIETIHSILDPIFSDSKIGKVGHNIKFDMIVLKNHGFPFNGIVFDSMVAGWMIDPASKNLGLKQMTAALTGAEMTHIETLIGKGKTQRTMAEVPISEAAPYAAADADSVLRLRPILREKLAGQNTESLFDSLEVPLIPVLAEMEMNGITLDKTILSQMSKELSVRIQEIEKEIYKLIGYSFNINSTQQLSKALFETLQLIPPDQKKKTTSGLYSTSADVLEEMRGVHPVIDLVLESRELIKLKNTYTDALPEWADPQTGRVHTAFNQTGTVTGRIASSSPNLQNIPTRTELGRKIRSAFITDPGWVLLSVDYSQIELRIVAHMSQDTAMLEAFRKGQDIHAATAAAIYQCDLSAVTKEMRRHAKAINFGLIYGMSSFGLSKAAGLTASEASTFVKAYFDQFPGVKKFLDGIRVDAAEKGYVETMLGRKRYFPSLKHEMNYNTRNRIEREAINAPVQGTAADIMKEAMIRLPDALLKENLTSPRILLQVHDELLLECPEEDLIHTKKVVQSVMENAFPLSIPLLTEAKSGKDWGDLSPMG